MTKAKQILFLCTFMIVTMWYAIWFENGTLTTILVDKTIGPEITKTYPYSKLKYILQWTKSYTQPFIYMGRGQNTFIKRQCPVNNCFITSDRGFLHSTKDFDAILFYGPELSTRHLIRLPRRSMSQKYVFVSSESSSIYPVYYNIYDGYFNWTWTYRLNSDVYYGYIIIKNKQGDIIGPKEDMHWLKVEEMDPVDNMIKQKLETKKIAAAWYVSHCHVKSKREKVAKLLQKELAKYNMTVDTFGVCGTKYCPRSHMKMCLRMSETNYYFYFAFENSLAEDYVTEKLLHALQHYTVPIVFGGANYSRFMPEGTYLNAQTINIEELVKQMVDLINDKQKYYNFFRWRNHYSFHYGEESPETDYYCQFCSKINDAKLTKEVSILQNFRQWWNINFTEN